MKAMAFSPAMPLDDKFYRLGPTLHRHDINSQFTWSMKWWDGEIKWVRLTTSPFTGDNELHGGEIFVSE